MWRFWTIVAAGTMLAGTAGAEGFAVKDLTTIEVDTAAFSTGDFETLPKTRRLMVACLDCPRTAVVTLELESGDPETESNLRDGILTSDILNEDCSAADGDVTCLDVEMIEVGNAIGWRTRTQVGLDRHLQTYELYLDGQKLNVQAIAESRDEADQIGDTAFGTIVPTIVLGTEG